MALALVVSCVQMSLETDCESVRGFRVGDEDTYQKHVWPLRIQCGCVPFRERLSVYKILRGGPLERR